MISKVKFKMGNLFPKSQKTNSIVKAIICFAVAGLITISIFAVQQTQNTVVSVLKPAKLITAGTKIKNTDVKVVEVGKYGLPKETLSEEKEIVGKYAKSDLYPADFITKDKLAEKKGEPFVTLAKDKKIMSFTVSNLAASVAGNIKNRDKIQVIYAEKVNDELEVNSELIVTMPECLKNLTVIDIKDTSAYNEAENAKASANASTGYIPAVITVIVNEEQAVELYRAEQTKSIYVMFSERNKNEHN